jgi:pimeloyl-ACP methyl ester carboxylesterase
MLDPPRSFLCVSASLRETRPSSGIGRSRGWWSGGEDGCRLVAASGFPHLRIRASMVRIRPIRILPALAVAALTPGVPAAAQGALELEPCALEGYEQPLRCGTWFVRENREADGGRMIPLNVVVIPPREGTARPDPIFFVAGGPGQTATELAGIFVRSPLREHREIVLVDQRGTSPGHALDCRLRGGPDDPQGWLEPILQPDLFRQCRRELEPRADLARYLTPDFADDLDEVRRALGYERINLMGGSYGTRVVLAYLRQHPRSARAAYATGLFPVTARNPLGHARDSQAALDSILSLCARDAACGGAFPHLRAELDTVVARLRAAPVRVTVADPATRETVEVTLDADGFAEGLRVTMYGWDRARAVPLLLHRAYGGDFRPFAEAAMANNAGVRGALRFGLLMSVICGEDMPRTTEQDIVRETAGTFYGDLRIRSQKAVCDEWPRRSLPPGYTDPVVSDVPVLLLSGAYDPATAPRWGDEAARTLSNSLHLVVPGAHTPSHPCIDRIVADFMDRGSVRGLDTSCVRDIRLPPFLLADPRP